MKVNKQCSGQISLKGQHSCTLDISEGIHEIYIKVNAGKLRLNHGCFTPDGGTWLDEPANGRQAHYDLTAPQEYHITVDVQASFGRRDKISIVNLQLFQEAVFSCEITEKAAD